MEIKISVAVCTKDHPDELNRCLGSLAAVRTKALEIVVIDNNSATEATRKTALAFQCVYEKETRPGLSAARNRALAAAKGDVIAFTDDDCEVTAGWIDAIRGGFADPGVGGVVGNAISLPSANRVQRAFDRHSRAQFADVPFEVTPRELGANYYAAIKGVGANMAFRRELLLSLDGFPEHLLTNGDDDYILYRVVQAGYKVRYEPGSLVYQHHRSALGQALKRFVEYGIGTMRVVWQISLNSSRLHLVFWNAGLLLLSNLRDAFRFLVRADLYPVLFSLAQFAGIAIGVFLPGGLRSLRHDRGASLPAGDAPAKQ